MSSKKNNASPNPTSRRKRWDPLAESEKHKFRVQSKPPLSLRQFTRSTINSNSNGEHWKPGGTYHPTFVQEDPLPKSPDDQSNVAAESRKDSRPVWRPPGAVKFKGSKSQKEENKELKSKEVETKPGFKMTDESESPWHPSGQPYYEPVPYFDAPSLRWSPQQIKQSMPEFKPAKNKPSTTSN